MAENETAPFMPFVPPGSAPLAPDGGPIENKPPKPPRKRKTAAPVGEGRTTKEAKAERQPRRKAPAKPAKKAPKFDLQTAMQIGAELSDLGEQTVFLKLFNDLSALPKGACKRIVGALAVALLNGA